MREGNRDTPARQIRQTPIMALARVTIILLVASLVVAANLWKSDLRIDRVVVEGNRIVSGEEITRLTGIRKREMMFDLDLFEVRRQVLRNHYIREASVGREAPGMILVRVEERVPVALVNAGRLFLLDREAFVLPAVASQQIFDIPIITGNLQAGDFTPGRQVRTPSVLESLHAIEAMQVVGDDVYRQISEIHLAGPDELVLFTVEGVPVLVGSGEYEEKLLRFAAFWEQIAMRGNVGDLEVVDLRYGDQVITRWKNGPPELPRDGQQTVAVKSDPPSRPAGIS